ncbi:MAG: hypothetical protein F2562_06340, partial [Actinobacteria bacterium]|nr:hypothetical protein [Actinomycetota bacterium]
MSRFVDDELDRRTFTVFLTALACLWAAHFAVEWAPDSFSRLAQMNWWAGSQIVFYLVVP